MSELENYIQTFLQEAEELLADIESAVLSIEECPDNPENINRLFRAMHTIKGSGAMFGFTEVSAFAHHVETVLDKVRGGSQPISRELIDLVLASRDQISALIAAANGGPAASTERGDAIIAGLAALCEDSAGEVAPAPSKTAQGKPSGGTYCISFQPEMGIFATGTDPAMLLAEVRELGDATIVADFQDLPDLDKMQAECCYLSWSITLTTDKGADAIRDVFIFVEDVSSVKIEEVAAEETVSDDEARPLLGEILVSRGDVDTSSVSQALDKQKKIGELLVEAGSTTPEKIDSALVEQQAYDKQRGLAAGETVRVPSDKLDQLINLVGELVITQAQLAQVAAGLNSTELASPVEEVERLTTDLRDIVLNIRMMPIGVTFGKFKRLVRDMSVQLGKEIELITEGAETEMDKTVIDRLGDPLVHLIRNSIDHGIEDPDERVAAGKARKGVIRLVAEHKGANVVISIDDDGKGIDVDVVRKKAVQMGLVSADAELSDQQVFSQIFAPGFSTAATVTDVSGRGVGMDVVRREIDALRGTISITSTIGSGTRIDLALPLTLAIIEGLLVDVNGDSFVVPLSLIEECLELTADRMAISSGRNLIQVRGEPVPFIRIREIFGMQGERPQVEETVVVSAGDQRVGLVVDRVIGHHQTVIKSLQGLYKNVEAVSGATILGDGTVALILDVSSLVGLARQLENRSQAGPARLHERAA